MKIVFCHVKYNGGYKKNGQSFEEKYWIEPLKKIGHDVYEFEMDDFLNGEGLNCKVDNGELLEFVKKIKPEIVMMNDYSNDTFRIENWKEISKICKTVNWFGDDNHRYDNYSKHKAIGFSNPVTCDFFSIDKYKKDGFKNIIMSQWGSIDFDNIQSEYVDIENYDVTFIGTHSPYRKFIYDSLIKAGINVKFFGNGWDGGKVSVGQMKYIFENSKINLNLEKIATNYDFRFMLHRPRAFLRYFLDKIKNKEKIIKQIKARHFEICACNGFQLLEYTPMIEQYYLLGKEVVAFSNIDDMIEIIKYYLARNEERNEIKKSGYVKTKKEHLMEHRLKEVIEKIERENMKLND